jgi:hypothetical protein
LHKRKENHVCAIFYVKDFPLNCDNFVLLNVRTLLQQSSPNAIERRLVGLLLLHFLIFPERGGGWGVDSAHCKKRFEVFPSPAGMSQTKLSLDGNHLLIPVPSRESLVSDIPAGDRKTANLFLQCLFDNLRNDRTGQNVPHFQPWGTVDGGFFRQLGAGCFIF